MTTSDEQVWMFNADKYLVSRTFANSEVLTYSYFDSSSGDPSDLDGKLKSVMDAYGRGLFFDYYRDTEPAVYKRGLLRYVGDHTVSDINNPQAGEYYIQLDYDEAQEDSSGSIVGNGEARLVNVTDVRNKIWTYVYEDTQLNALNFLKQIHSPITGHILKDLIYTLNNGVITDVTQDLGILNGNPALQSIEYAFQPNGRNYTTETIAGETQTHYFAGGVYAGTGDASGNASLQGLNSDYRPIIQADANGNLTDLEWQTGGKLLNKVTDAQGNETSFSYDSQDRLISSSDAEGRLTEYTYGDTTIPRQSTVIKVKDIDGTTLLRQQEFVYDSKGRTTSEKLIDPSDGTTVLQETARVYGTSGNGNGLLESIEIKDLLDSSNNSSTVYSYDAQGRLIRTNKTSMFGTCEFNHTVYDAAGNVLGTACGLVTANPIPSDEVGLLALYDANDSNKKHTRITTHDYDEMGRRVETTSNAGTNWARTNRTLYDALGRVVRSIQNYVEQGSSAPGDWVWDESVEEWHYSSSDSTVVSHGTNLDENILSDMQYNGRGLVNLRRDVLGRVTLYGYNTADRLVKTVQNASDDSYDMSYATGDPELSAYVASSNVDEDMITEQVYDPNGNVVKSIDARGSVTFTALDVLNRPVKVISNANQPEYDILADLDLSAYGAYSADPDKDMVSTSDYDAMGRVIRSQRLLENRGANETWDTMLYGYDALGRQVRSIQHASDADYDLSADASLASYTLSSDSDVDMLTETVYDTQGRVKETLDVNGRVNRMVYDGLNRQVMTVASYVAQVNPPEAWEWTNNQWEDGSANAIEHGDNFDQNIISETVYDSDGRVEFTRNVEGLVSRNAYDGVGNRVQQTVSSIVTDYLNDVQPALTKLLRQDDGTNVEHFVHGVRGIHAVDDGTDWNFYAQDGLGSVRAVVDDMAVVQSSMSYDPYGNPMGAYGEGFGFTGEQADANGIVFLRARYYEPSLGTFIKRDPAETANRYGYVSGNPINLVDPSGLMSVGYGRASSGNSINGVRTNINWNPIYWNLENPFVVQSMNSGLCSESITTGNKRRYRHGGGDIQQDASNSGFNELIQQITNSYPVSNVTRGLDVNAQQITDSPIESLHGNVVRNLLIALNAMDSKLMTINKSLGEIFDQQELTIALDYVGLNGEFSGITPYGIPNFQRLGNNMIPSHIVHEWGHAIDRKDNFRHSDELASQTVKSFADIPSQANISIFNTVSNVQITGANTGCSPVPLTQEIEYPFGVSRQRIISGTPPNSGAYQRCLVGYGDIANNGIDAREDWADMFMNWVFDGRSDGGNAGFNRVSNLANVSKTSELYTLASFAQARRRWMENYTSTAF